VSQVSVRSTDLEKFSAASSRSALDRVAVAALAAIVALLLVATYFTPPVWQHGEAREGMVIWDIVIHHRWILPLRGGELPSKPIFYHWLASGLALLMGLSDFTIRLPSVVGAALLASVTYVVATFGAGRKVGLMSIGILVATFEFWDSGTEARVDMLFASLIALALAAWYVWYGTGNRWAHALAYLAVALSVLTKGPAGAVLPGLVIVGFLLLQRELAKLGEFFSWPWLLLVLAIDLGWYWAAYQRGGPAFLQKQIVYENLLRFFGGAEFQMQKSRALDALWLVTQIFPWSLLLLASLVRWRRGRSPDRFGYFLHAWWFSIFLFFLLSAGRRAVYLLPIYPAVAVLAAREGAALLEAWEEFSDGRRWQIGAWTMAALVLAAIDLTLALATPVSRILQSARSDQEKFFDEMIPNVPANAPLYAAPDFPETAVKVLDYRLGRSIAGRELACQGDYYYLATRTPQAACAGSISVVVADRGKVPLRLLHVSGRPAEAALQP